MARMAEAGRLYVGRDQLRFRRYHDDFGRSEISAWWDGLGGAPDPIYVVQTNTKVIERCMLMATDPGDLVLDPTCGSGTTAYVAEQWGRRWITIDTSRVAVALARQRLLTAQFDHYALKQPEAGVDAGFQYKTAPHIMSSVVANCDELDPIINKHAAVLAKKLAACSEALKAVSNDLRKALSLELDQKRKGNRAITQDNLRQYNLPSSSEGLRHWTVPFEPHESYPAALKDAIDEYQQARRAKADEINACVGRHAVAKDIINEPVKTPRIVRVSGPFTVEAVQPPEQSLDAEPQILIEGAPDPLEETFEAPGGYDGETAVKNVEAYLDQMMRLVKLDGVGFPDNRRMAFTHLEPMNGRSEVIHAEGRWVHKGEADTDPDGKPTVCVAFGPQYGPVTAKQVEQLIRAPSRRGYDDLVIAAFTFDGAAQAVIEEADHPRLRIHMAHIRPDVNPGMQGLLKDTPNSQLFTVFGQPRTRLKRPDKNGQLTVVMEGVDIYDPVTNAVTPTRADKVAAWFIDGDYDGRTFCITQAFFPDKDAWAPLSEALKHVIDESAFAALSGTESLPFPVGENRCVAVKVIDPRGNEVMRLHPLED
jgi:adenine-specific DNA-methyltransferase